MKIAFKFINFFTFVFFTSSISFAVTFTPELLEAAKKGDANSQNIIGVCYGNGLGIEKNQEEAVKWLEKSAAQGFAKAKYNLAGCYLEGEFVKKDEKKAFQLFKESAQTLQPALLKLGFCYATGLGTPKNPLYAYACIISAGETEDGDINKLIKKEIARLEYFLESDEKEKAIEISNKIKKGDFSGLVELEITKVLSSIYNYAQIQNEFFDVEIVSFPIFAVRCFLRQDTQNEVIFGENDEIVTSVISIPLEKYPTSREKINEIISIINERHHFKNAIRCNYLLEENRYELNFIIPKKNESFTEEIINSFTNTSLNELQRNILLFTYVEKNLEPIEAFDIAYNLDINFDLPLSYRGVRNYDSKELGYSIRYDNANENPTLIVDEYYYSNGRTWKDGIADDELKKHFKSLADDLPTFYKEFKETTPIVIEKISNQEYLTQTYELLRNDKKAFSKTYITAINGKLLKFRVSFYLTDKESKEKADKLIEMRTAKRLELLQKAK